MSIHPAALPAIPETTRRVAQAAFPQGNPYLRLRDELGDLYPDTLFADLFPRRGQPALPPGQLALVTVFQFLEDLSDRQAAEAVRARIDWKYALGLELTDPGFNYSVLSEFRARLAASNAAERLLDPLLRALQERGLLKARGRQRTDSTHVLAAVRQLNRLELAGETLRRALNEVAAIAPQWLQALAPPEWFRRYGTPVREHRLPTKSAERDHLIQTMARDGFTLLEAIRAAPERDTLQALPGVELLRQIWLQQFWIEHTDAGPQIRLRPDNSQPPGEQRIHSPYDVQARYSAKHQREWVGYKVCLTETCDADELHLITQVTTCPAVIQDISLTAGVQTALAAKGLLPQEHLMDGGFVAADELVSAARDHGITICGPVKKDVRWQANTPGGYDVSQFDVDWANQVVTCPQGQRSTGWSLRTNRWQKELIYVKFRPSVCKACPARSHCTRMKSGARTLLLRPQRQHEALQRVRREQGQSEFRQRYAARAGIEGTISEGVRAHDLRQSRYVGEAKTHVQMVASAVALNIHRLIAWLQGIPRSSTRISVFAGLAPEGTPIATGWQPC